MTGMTLIALIGLGIVLTAGTGLFVAAEFSLVALDPVRAERRAAAGDKRAGAVVNALAHLSTHLSGAQVGITITTILLGYTTQVALTEALTRLFGSWGVAAAVATTLGVVLALVAVNAFSMIFGELVPKNAALSNPMATAGRVVGVQKAFTWLFKPVIKVLNGTANRVVKALGVEPMEELSSARSASELAAIVSHSAAEGSLDTSTATLFTRSVALAELSAVDVMRNRGRVEALPQSASAADVVERARLTGHSRFPIYGHDLDDIVGLVHLRRAIAIPFARRSCVSVCSSSLMVPAPRVPETVGLAPLLVQLRGEGLQMAVVVDEYGGTSGIVTLEDVVEEIVGEVADEHDPRRRGIQVIDRGGWRIAGTLRPDEISDRIGVILPDDGPYETVAGLVLSQLGRLPVEGDAVRVGDVTLTVERMEGRRIASLKLVAPTRQAGVRYPAGKEAGVNPALPLPEQGQDQAGSAAPGNSGGDEGEDEAGRRDRGGRP